MENLKIEYLTPLLEVFNMPLSLAFYRDVLGFEIAADSGDGDDSSWVWLRRDEFNLMLNDQYEPGLAPAAPPADRVRWHKDICLYFGCRDVDAAYEFLIARSVSCSPPKTAPYGMRQLYLLDPDGYNICFQWPTE